MRYISQKYYFLSIHDADAFNYIYSLKTFLLSLVTGCYKITNIKKGPG